MNHEFMKGITTHLSLGRGAVAAAGVVLAPLESAVSAEPRRPVVVRGGMLRRVAAAVCRGGRVGGGKSGRRRRSGVGLLSGRRLRILRLRPARHVHNGVEAREQTRATSSQL